MVDNLETGKSELFMSPPFSCARVA